MAGKWVQLAPHFLGMFVLYVIGIIAVWEAFGLQSFWVSLVVALAIAVVYPVIVRRLGVAPEVWQRTSDE